MAIVEQDALNQLRPKSSRSIEMTSQARVVLRFLLEEGEEPDISSVASAFNVSDGTVRNRISTARGIYAHLTLECVDQLFGLD